jgi:hypothetical protein
MESVVVSRLAAAISCHPRTLARRLIGPSSPLSSVKDQVSLARAAQFLGSDPTALSLFLKEEANGTDEALTVEYAAMVLGISERQVYSQITDKTITPLIHFGKTLRFSRNALLGKK